jgi:hypothetical protein
VGEAKVNVGPRPLKTEMDEVILFKKNCVYIIYIHTHIIIYQKCKEK